MRIEAEIKRANSEGKNDYTRYDEAANEIYVRGQVIFTKQFADFQATIAKQNPGKAEPAIVLIGPTTISTF